MTESVDLSETRQTEVLTVAWVTTGAAVLTVLIKLFARAKVVRVVGWDDFFIFLSLIFSIIASSFVHYGVLLGFGQHTAVIAAKYGNERLFKGAMIQMLGYPAFSFPNISIAILVCQLLSPNPPRTIALYSMAILQVVFAMITIALAFAQCQPARKLWEKTLPGSCWNPNVLNYFSYWLCAYTTLTDIILAVVPARTFWSLQMPWSTKIGLIVMMGMTMLSAIVTIIKGTYLPLFTDTTDPLWKPVPLVIWGLVEQNIVIMAACVPTMRPFFNRAWKRGFSTRSSSNSKSLFKDKFKPTNIRRGGLKGPDESMSAVALNEIEGNLDQAGRTVGDDDAMTHESQREIVRIVETSDKETPETAAKRSIWSAGRQGQH